jgi:hypothetical protein
VRWLTGDGSEVRKEFQGSRRFTRAAWRGLRRLEGLVPTVTRDGGEREIDGEVDAVLKGGDGGAGELHGNQAKLLEGLVWIEKRRGELSTAGRSDSNGVQRSAAFRWREHEGMEKNWL